MQELTVNKLANLKSAITYSHKQNVRNSAGDDRRVQQSLKPQASYQHEENQSNNYEGSGRTINYDKKLNLRENEVIRILMTLEVSNAKGGKYCI